MMKAWQFVVVAALTSAPNLMTAASLEPLHRTCTIGIGEKAGTFRLESYDGDCDQHGHCGENRSDVSTSRLTGISLADLAPGEMTGVHRTATIDAEAGVFTCTGSITDNELKGESVFTPRSEFVTRMEKMGFPGFNSDELMAYALLDVRSAWAQSLKDIGIRGIDSGNLIALRVFNVDPDYVQSMTALGFPLPDAGELINMRVQGVNAAEVAEFRAMGYKPTLDQLVQIRIFKVTPDFIRSMQARGFKNLTIDKLVQIRIFKLAD